MSGNPRDDLQKLINDTHAELRSLQNPPAEEPRPEPAQGQPMAAPSYSEAPPQLAKTSGLGRKR